MHPSAPRCTLHSSVFSLLLSGLALGVVIPGPRTLAAELATFFSPATVEVGFEPAESADSLEWQLAAERDANGEWIRRDGDWLAAGSVQSGLAPGTYGLVFRAAGGWRAPPAFELNVPPGGTISRTVTVERLPVFALGDIPPHSVRQGETLSFRVTGATSVDFEPHSTVDREVSFEDGVFRYRPTPDERRAFGVTFDGDSGSQDVTVTPTGASEAEQSVLLYRADHPDPEARAYLHVTVESRTVSPPLNYDQDTVRDIAISGPRVVFAPGHANGLYDGLLGLDGAPDTATLTIYADQVIIEAPLRLPQTDVTIYARELRFIDDGALNTTPIQKPGTAATGSRGRDGSTVTLNVGGVFVPEGAPNVPRLIVRGGDGQVGTPGRNGASLSNPVAQNYSVFQGTSSCTPVPFPAVVSPAIPARVVRAIIMERCAGTRTKSDQGTRNTPRSGNPAVPNGVSGNGGNGGALSAPFSLEGIVDVSGGTDGPRQPARSGSAGDRPYNARRASIGHDCFCKWDGSWSLHEFRNVAGADAPATVPPGPAPRSGAASSELPPSTWLHPVTIRAILDFTRDVYLNGYYEDARELLRPYSSALAALAGEEKSVELVQVEEEIGTLLQRLVSQLDYFGNPAGWVPLLSFEVLFGLYEREVESAGDVLYLTHFLGERADEAIDRAATIQRLRSELEEEIETFREDLETTSREIDGLTQTAATIEKSIEEARVTLDDRRQMLEAEARFNAGLKKAFRVVGAILPMIPVAQPALALAGTALTTASKFNEEPPKSLAAEFIASAIPIGVETFQSEDEEEPETDEEKKAAELQKRAQFAAAAITGVVAVAREAQSWESDVEAELNLLVSRDPQSKQLAGRIRELNKEKLRFAEKLLATTQKARQLMEGIAQNFLARESLNREAVIVDGKIDQQAFCYIREIERRAKDRLLYYQYLMAKAYEYRMLDVDHGVNYQLDGLFEFYRNLATPEDIPDDPAQSIISNLEFEGDRLIDIYTAELRAITSKVVEQILDTGVERSSTTFYFLNEAQLTELNRERVVRINLAETPIFNLAGELIRFGIFGDDKDAIRLRNLSVQTQDIRVSSPSGISRNDVVEITVTHPGVSQMEFDGETYTFNHRQTSEREDLFWKTTYFPSRDEVRPDEPAAAADSLIRNLLLGRSGEDILTYSRTGAWTDLTVRLSTTNPDLVLDELTLTVDYDYLPRKAGSAILSIRPMTEEREPLTPRIVLSAADRNGRRDGRGDIRRTFSAGERVTLEAPELYGAYVFDHWVDGTTDLGPDPVLEVDLSASRQVRAVYRFSDDSSAPRDLFVRGDSNLDESVDLSDVTTILDFLFQGRGDLLCLKAADANDDGELDVSDPVTLLLHLFGGVDALPPPFGACGADATNDRLTCLGFSLCQ